MFFHVAANALAALHLAFILFVVFGGLLVLRRRWVMGLHLPAAVWGVLIEFGGWYCPLTAYENAALRRAGLAGYSGGFAAHYIFPLIYPNGLTRGVEIAIGALVLIINLIVYVRVFR